jgi:RNA recognition motif-containing protein
VGFELFLANLPFDWDETNLTKKFKDHATIESVAIVRDPLTQKSHGSAFMVVESQEEADQLVEKFNKKSLEGRLLIVRRSS